MSLSQQFDRHILFAALALLLMGLIMVCSASITMAESKTGQPLFFFIRQFIANLVLSPFLIIIKIIFPL